MRALSLSTLLGLIVGTVALISLGATARGDEASKQRLLKEGRPALQRLQKRYSQIRGSGLQTIDKKALARAPRDGDPVHKIEALMERSRIDFRLDGDSRKLVVEQLDGTKPGVAKIKTLCVTPTLSFVVDRASAAEPPVLKSVGKGPSGNTSKMMDLTVDHYMMYACLSTTYLKDIFDENHVAATLIDVIPLDRGGRKLLKVEIERHMKSKKNDQVTEVKETLILAPDENWALQEYEGRIGEGVRTTRAVYGPQVDGFPTLKQVVTNNGRDTITFEFTDFKFGPSPASEFTPASAGVPDLEVPAAPKRNNSSFYFIGAGVLAAVAAVLLRVFRRI